MSSSIMQTIASSSTRSTRLPRGGGGPSQIFLGLRWRLRAADFMSFIPKSVARLQNAPLRSSSEYMLQANCQLRLTERFTDHRPLRFDGAVVRQCLTGVA